MKLKLFLLIICLCAYKYDYCAQAPLPKITIKPIGTATIVGLSPEALEEFKNLIDQLSASKIPEVMQTYKELQNYYNLITQKQIYKSNLKLQLEALLSKISTDPSFKDKKFETPTYGYITLENFATLFKDSRFMKELTQTVSLFGISQQTINYFNEIINTLPDAKSAPLEVIMVKNKLIELNQKVHDKTISLDELLLKLKALEGTIEKNPKYAAVQFENPIYGRLTLGQFSQIILGSLIDDITNKVGLTQFRPLPPTPNTPPLLPQPGAPTLNPPGKAKPVPAPKPVPVGAAPSAPHGLANVGNSCFMNASLQNLFALDDLTTGLLARMNTGFYPANSFADEYLNFINQMYSSSATVIEPKALCMRGWQRMHFAPLSQQDNDEFISILLTDLLKDKDSLRPLLEIKLQTFLDGKPSESEKAPELLLSIPANKASLDENLKDYFAVEKVEYGYPPKPVDKQEKIVRTGQYLIIHLKRNVPKIDPKTKQIMFDKSDQMMMDKLTQPIPFPLANLDLNDYAIPGADLSRYRLKGMVIHAGNARGGHYTGYVRYGNQWYFVNDSDVSRVSQQQMEQMAKQGFGSSPQQTPTTFFYERM